MTSFKEFICNHEGLIPIKCLTKSKGLTLKMHRMNLNEWTVYDIVKLNRILSAYNGKK